MVGFFWVGLAGVVVDLDALALTCLDLEQAEGCKTFQLGK
jgi:hypothetical protein